MSPLHVICTLVCLRLLLDAASAEPNITFAPSHPEVFVDDTIEVLVTLSGTPDEIRQARTSNWTADGTPGYNLEAHLSEYTLRCDDLNCSASVQITGRFLGFGYVQLWREEGTVRTRQGSPLQVIIRRQHKVINTVFTAFVATVVTINYINMGCALDLEVVKNVLRRPVGPAVGAFCQFVVMPLVSFGVGHLMFDDPVMRLGLFTFGSSPGGGASNMWTVLLGGNLNLSITMTFVSTIAALGTIPFWLFTLGKRIVYGTNVVIPFKNILISLVTLMVPIGIGLLIQRRWPKLAAKSKRILAPVCIILLICIIVLASIANSYIFFMLTWRMVIAAGISVWTGFVVGGVVSLLFRFQRADIVAVAIETGIQNSGIAFILLSYSLKAPYSDMASVVPVAASIITPIPLFTLFCYQKIVGCCCRAENFELKALSAKEKAGKGEDNLAMTEANIN